MLRVAVLLLIAAVAMGAFGWWWALGKEQRFIVRNEAPYPAHVWGLVEDCGGGGIVPLEEGAEGKLVDRFDEAEYSRRFAQFEAGMKCVYVADGTNVLRIAEPYRADGVYILSDDLPSLGEVYIPSVSDRTLSDDARDAAAHLWPFAVAGHFALSAVALVLYDLTRRLRAVRGGLEYPHV